MVGRHMMPISPTTPSMLVTIMSILAVLKREFPAKQLTPYSQEQVIEELPAVKKQIALDGYAEMLKRGWGKWATRISAFVKYEPAQYDPGEPPECKEPRLIQHRHPGYCYTLAQYLRPLEHYLFRHRFGRRTTRPWTTKGMDSWAIGERLSQMERWSDTVFIECDHSRFDSRLRAELRDMEFSFYKTFYRNDTWLAELLKQQIDNRGTTRGGIKYKVHGTMMSGEYNTSLGDSVINYGVLRYWAGPEADIVVNGDDSVIAVPRRVFERLDFAWFDTIGFKTKTDVKFQLSEVTYCQCRPVRVNGRWRMVRDPWRVMSRAAYTIKNYSNQALYDELVFAKGAGELCCNQGVPVLQAFAQRMIECGRARTGKHIDAVRRYMAEHRRADKILLRCEPVTPQARTDFAIAFGISVPEQLALEQALAVAPFYPLPCSG